MLLFWAVCGLCDVLVIGKFSRVDEGGFVFEQGADAHVQVVGDFIDGEPGVGFEHFGVAFVEGFDQVYAFDGK